MLVGRLLPRLQPGGKDLCLLSAPHLNLFPGLRQGEPYLLPSNLIRDGHDLIFPPYTFGSLRFSVGHTLELSLIYSEVFYNLCI